MTIQYQIYSKPNQESGITLILEDGTVHTLDGGNANFTTVRDRLLAQGEGVAFTDEEVLDLLKPAVRIGQTLQALSERFATDGVHIYFDGDLLDNGFSRHLLRILEEGGKERDYRALIAFAEKLATNPSEASRQSLFEFIRRYDITISQDGDFIVYKGVRADGRSINSGFGIVNGVVMNGSLPNEKGSVLEIPRSKVDADTSVGCSTGLHAGTYSYASNFAQGRLLTVKVNPRDVVSVPDDCTYQKIRVSRYEVVDAVEHEITTPTWDEDECDDECDECEGGCEDYAYGCDADCCGSEDEDEDGEEESELPSDWKGTTAQGIVADLHDGVTNLEVKFDYQKPAEAAAEQITGVVLETAVTSRNNRVFTMDTPNGIRSYRADRIVDGTLFSRR